MSTHLLQEPQDIVIDTQTVMDFLVFADASCAALLTSLERGELRWHSSPKMLAELEHVLGRGVAAAWSPQIDQIRARFLSLAQVTEHEAPSVSHLMRCRDKDDQMFLDLALALKVPTLISRDRALLALAKRARAHGLQILTAVAWSKQRASALLTVPSDGA